MTKNKNKKREIELIYRDIYDGSPTKEQLKEHESQLDKLYGYVFSKVLNKLQTEREVKNGIIKEASTRPTRYYKKKNRQKNGI